MEKEVRKILSIVVILLIACMFIPQKIVKVYAAEDSNEITLFKGEASATGEWDPWGTVTAAYFSKGVAYYTYDAICDKYGSDFSKLDNISVKPGGSDVTVTSVTLCPENSSDININYKGIAGKIMNNINVGWNLGNTLECQGDWITQYKKGTPEDFETAWGNPVTTKSMIDKVKAASFNEMLDENFNWQYPGTEATNAVNTFNQMFVDTVRSAGGNNATRCLIVNKYICR